MPQEPRRPLPRLARPLAHCTRRLVDVGKLLGIAVLDHVIIGDGTESYFSFADEGLL